MASAVLLLFLASYPDMKDSVIGAISHTICIGNVLLATITITSLISRFEKGGIFPTDIRFKIAFIWMLVSVSLAYIGTMVVILKLMHVAPAMVMVFFVVVSWLMVILEVRQ
jgi:hypothetical protein